MVETEQGEIEWSTATEQDKSTAGAQSKGGFIYFIFYIFVFYFQYFNHVKIQYTIIGSRVSVPL